MKQFLPILCLLAGTPAYATTIQFTSLPPDNQFGTYNGYVTATIDGIPNELLICDDFYHTTYVPSGPIEYSLSYLTGTPLATARFADPGPSGADIMKYQEAAVLLDRLNHTGPDFSSDSTADYQYALWLLFSPSITPPSLRAQTLLNEAAASVQQGGLANQALYSQLRIYTPTSEFASNQEFLQLSPGSPAVVLANPEPSPAILIAIGMAAIALSASSRKWMRYRQEGRETLTAMRANVPPQRQESKIASI